jgi:hypothetical protein
MSTLKEFLTTTRKRGLFWWLSFYKEYILSLIYEKKVSNKVDNSWKGVKLSKTITPKGWTKEGAFEFLGKEYNGIIMKRYADNKK